ncbi:hypothetical protein JCM10449v2_005490 [Rhodotorula kratochvilovae]
MDLPPPAQQARIQQQRPSLAYFVFLSLLFYLMSSNQSSSASLAFEARPSDDSFRDRYAAARADLLRREARGEGIARWLGRSNRTGDFLNSTFFPDVANGSAPLPLPLEPNATAPPALTEAWRIPPFEPHSDGELAPVPALVARLFADATPRDDQGRVEARVYPQNLTGYAKGSWEVRKYSFEELGVNETWTTERLVEMPRREEARNGTMEEGGTSEVAEEASSTPAIARRQAPAANDTNTPDASSRNFTTVYDVHNRTLARGSFPWVSPLASPPSQHASFNLREVQTSAVGPVEPLPTDPEQLDEAALLRLKEHPEAWEDWEREGPVTYLWGPLTLRVEAENGEDRVTELDVEAVHFLTRGRIYGYATPRFVPAHIIEAISLPLMSSYSPNPNRTARAIGHAILDEFDRRVARDVRELEESGPRLGEEDYPRREENDEERERPPTCVFSLYGALSPLPREYTFARYAEYYTSLFRPSGASLRPPPPSTLSALLSSPNCGLVLAVPSAALTPTQALWLRATHFGVLFLLTQGAALVLLVRQLERAAGRPGTVANAQPVGFAMNVIVDLYVFVVALLVGVVTDSRASAPFLAGAFLALLSSVMFGLRYVALIREATPAPAPSPAPAPTPTPAAAGEGAAEAESAGPRRVLPEPVGRVLAGWRAKHTVYAMLALAVLFTAGYLISHAWTAFLLWLLYSYWIPQIVLNVHRGTARQSLADEYVVGTTVARLVPPLYFWGYEGNCMMVETSPKILYLVAYSALQAALLLAQSHLSRPSAASSRFAPPGGARFFLPAALIRALDLPQTSSWDYHPRVLPPSLVADLEAGKAGAEAEEDCPICLSAVHLHPTKAELAAGQADEVRRAAAVTPCAHVVHTECLEQWMMVRAVCPVCRAGLPPLAV